MKIRLTLAAVAVSLGFAAPASANPAIAFMYAQQFAPLAQQILPIFGDIFGRMGTGPAIMPFQASPGFYDGGEHENRHRNRRPVRQYRDPNNGY